MTTLKIEDYLHLYLGCRIKSKGGKLGDLVTVNDDGSSIVVYDKDKLDDPRGLSVKSDWLLPILRPLSDMTEEEKVQVIRVRHPEKEFPILIDIDLDKDVLHFLAKTHKMKYSTIFACGYGGTWHPEEIKYLLKQGFDLFGLIEAGLALDKTVSPHLSKEENNK